MQTSIGSNNNKNSVMPLGEKAAAVGYWIPRHEMVKLMMEEIDLHNQREGSGGTITLCTGQECTSVSPSNKLLEEDGGVIVKAVSAIATDASSKEEKEYIANLVIGADGMNSNVRFCLAHAAPGTWSSNCVPSSQFQLKQYTSPASYLRIKVLQLPPRFQIKNVDGPLTTTAKDIYAIQSKNSLGLLPMKDNNAVRPTNIITRPNHEIWNINDGNSMREYFQKAFPRLDFQKDGGIISEDEWERFAKAEGTRFPPCQYSPGLAVWDESGRSGVALVGDAIHAFSPDIGQGVNAGLMDVVCLDRALSGLDPETGEEKQAEVRDNNSASLGSNLERYQKRHAPEIAALIRLARFGAPYQYNQPHRADRVLKKLWTANVVMRLILSKLTFGLIQPPCIILSQNGDLTFCQVMNRADRTTVLLKTVLLSLLALWTKKFFKLTL